MLKKMKERGMGRKEIMTTTTTKSTLNEKKF